MRTQVFISYRRNGGLEAAKNIYETLKDSYEVFFDKESLRNGRFDLNIENAIRSCTDFLLILSDQIFNRFEDEGDWISRELELALKYSKNIIPIFLHDFIPPVTKNETIRTVMNYNGLQYSNPDFFENLLIFLMSNKKCVLNLECDETGYKLGTQAIDELKAIYRRTRYTKEYGVRIVLNFPALNVAGEKLVSKELCGHKREIAVKNKILQLIDSQQRKRDRLELAIEYMIGDTCNIECAPLWEFLKNEPLTKEHYLDENGSIQSYFSVCVWVHIIEELLREITLGPSGRFHQYANEQRNEYTKIDCIRKDRPLWSFTTFAKNEECTKSIEYYQFMELSPFTLSPQTILTMILPDFYFQVAHDLLYRDIEKLHKDLMDPECTIRILECYWFGLH